ncbi:hypothetical protein ACIP5Y_21195 [Nocardia sp. NPDC088792]|uniref:hypothetical protein n=1 Tax=Nocardia sp. NPDC088792 TaxID=3364332 RepID=UPI0037F22F93
MPDRTITTTSGSTVTLTERQSELVVLLDHSDAPVDMRPTVAGRVIDGGFQPAPFANWALLPPALRAIADLIDELENHDA